MIASALNLPVDSPEVKRLVKASFKHLLQTIFEIMRFDKLKKDWSKLVQVEGIEHYEMIRQTGQGTILFSGHVGNWELLISGLSLLGFDNPHALVWKQPESKLNNLLDHQRALWGTQIVWTQEYDEKYIGEILSRGGTLLIFSDRYEQGRTKVKLFGHSIGTPAGPALLARKYNTALLPIHTFRQGLTHKVIIEPPLKLDPVPSSRDLTPDLQRCISYIERWILQNPEQWIWLFKRGEWGLEKQNNLS